MHAAVDWLLTAQCPVLCQAGWLTREGPLLQACWPRLWPCATDIWCLALLFLLGQVLLQVTACMLPSPPRLNRKMPAAACLRCNAFVAPLLPSYLDICVLGSVLTS